ncbi:exodeoxyribonuclease III [Anaerorhabdus furcosa]|uniref:Exodeoxyribonuclease-3 n=1 Tax=Anaerorhabdus furcosa TaxID=118967 RepID=A0A1T4LHB7_9FIRM|nr:exodeoxyribonuclease III [Anaerorhabdus furcosa]SJZ53937.1 exodeoxyribonuclease-3 [Anaerorhabdus furcosa]
MKLISWNVNGLRACITKGFLDFFNEEDADIFCVQETKLQPHQIELELKDYYQYWHSAERKGYSGTAVFTKKEPISIQTDFGKDIFNDEGRVLTLEFDKFYLVNAYVPNSKEELARLDYRMEWEDELRNHLINLEKKKPVIYCGDLNVAHQEIDLKNPKTNRRNPGFSDEEREKMTTLLGVGFIDTYRTLYPEAIEYSWWSYRFNSREKNTGWRIDYFITSATLKDKVMSAKIYTSVLGSDHCPVGLEINI